MNTEDLIHFYGKQKREFLPTYRLQPIKGKKFSVAQVEKVTEHVVKEKLSHELYDPIRSKLLVAEIVNDIRDQVKALEFDRYKIVVFAQIGSVDRQCLKIASRCVWAEKTDNYATVSFQNCHLFAVVTVFGIYHE